MFNDTGHFECCKCSKKFSMAPEWLSAYVECPSCGHLYAKWIDYKRFAEHKRKSRKV